MRINKIHLENFRKFDSLTVEFHEDVAKIFGKNAAGKSTIYDAFLWCAFGISKEGHSNSLWMKPVRNGHLVPNAVVSVTVETDKDTFKRVQTEKRKNGEVVSHKTEYFINGDKVSKQAYDSVVSEKIGNVDRYKVFSRPGAIMDLPAKDRRDIILFGIDDDVLNLQEKIEEIDVEIDNAREKYKELQIRFDENERNLPDNFESVESLKKKQKELSKEIEEITDKISESERSIANDLLEWERKKANLEKEIDSLKSKYRETQSERQSAILIETKSLKEKISTEKEKARADYEILVEKYNRERDAVFSAKQKKSQLENELERIKSEAERKKAEYENVKEEYERVKSEQFSDTKCPTCGREWDKNKLDKMLSDFEKSKQERLDKIKAIATELKAEVENLRTLYKSKKEEIENISIPEEPESPKYEEPETIKEIESKIAELEKKLETVKGDDKILKQIEDKKKELDEHSKHMPQSSTANTSELRERRVEIKRLLSEIEDKIIESSKAEEKIKRHEELKKEVSENADKIEKLKQKRQQILNEILEAAESLEEKINANFKYVKWKLYKVNMSGTITPVCDAYVDGVKYEYLNTAMKINAGIDIVAGLSKQHNIFMPLFVDNAESVESVLETENQQIHLIFKKGVNKLRIEGGTIIEG